MGINMFKKSVNNTETAKQMVNIDDNKLEKVSFNPCSDGRDKTLFLNY
jgi:hypothetical protein